MPETKTTPHPDSAVTVVCLHGIGFGPWLFEPWRPYFDAAGLRMITPTLPGHGDGADPSLNDVVAFVERLLDGINGPVVLLGHSFGGLVAQIIAARRTFYGVVLVCPLVPGQIRFLPSLKGVLPLLPDLVAGRPLKIPWSVYRAQGLNVMEEAAARAVYEKIVPWPNRLVRDLARRPHVDPTAVKSPVLVAIGKLDGLLPWRSARLLGDFYECLVWRYDDLGHTPMFEPNSARMGEDVAGFCATPSRPQVIESEAFRPDEGVGHTLRHQRRGEAMKKRSAYGQRASARKDT